MNKTDLTDDQILNMLDGIMKQVASMNIVTWSISEQYKAVGNAAEEVACWRQFQAVWPDFLARVRIALLESMLTTKKERQNG